MTATQTRTLPQPVIFRGTWGRYHALLLKRDGDRCKIALCDHIARKWWTLRVDADRVEAVRKPAHVLAAVA